MKKEFARRVLALLCVICILVGTPTTVFATSFPNQSVEAPNYTTRVSSEAELQVRLSALISKYVGTYWTSSGNACSNHSSTCYSKYYYGWQCKGFASYIFNDLFCSGYIGAYDSNKYYIPSPQGATLIAKAWNISSGDTETVRSILSQAKPGDYIQTRRRGKSYGHSMIVVSVDANGVQLFDCNSDGKCGVKNYYQTWATFASKNIGMSLYHSTNYPGPEPCNCSETYAGNYTCTTSTVDLTIRNGHGTSFAKIGQIPPGATVYVSKASGTSASDWAHVEYNGVSGYASMEYLSKQQSVQAGIKHWLSDTAMGEKVSTFEQGNYYYLCYEIKDANTGKLLSEIGNYSYSVKQMLLYPDGTVGTECTYDNDNNWIAIKCTVPGTYSYKIEVKVEGVGSGTFTKTFDVKANPLTIMPSSTEVNLKIGENESQVVQIDTGGYYDGKSNLSCRRSNTNVSCSWGDWTGTGWPLTITANNEGTTDLTISIVDSDTKEVLLSTVIKVTVSNNSYTISYNANGGTEAPSNQTKIHNENVTLSNTVPERFGYTFLGWSTSKTATSASYKPGESYSSNVSTTLYAVWQSAEEISSNVVNSSYTVSVPFAKGYEYYRFIPSTTGKYRFESTGSLDSRIYLYTVDGTSVNWNDDAGNNTNFLLTEELKAGNTYYIKTCIYGSGIGEYTFTVKREYNVVYDVNGGTGAPSNQTKIHGTTLTLSNTKPTRDGYTFLGWNTLKNATTAKYKAGDSYTLNESVKLYAIWQSNMSIITQPTNVSITEGQTASFSVKVSGSNLKYQWQYCPSGSSSWSNSSESGSKTDTLNIEETQAKNGYKYRCVVTDGAGNTITSSTATLTVTVSKPNAVSGLKIGGRATDALRLNWNKNSNVSGYIIEQYKDGKWTRIARIGSNSTTTYRVERLSASTTYKFRIQSFGFDGNTAIYSGWQYVNGTTK